MGPLGEIFNPGMRHEIEERRSKALRREEEGNARDADLRIDLESGFVNIVAPPSTPDAARSEDDSDTTDGSDSADTADEHRAPASRGRHRA